MNVLVKAIDVRTGEVKAKRRGHNVFTNRGRKWLRDSNAVVSFDGMPMTGGVHFNDTEGEDRNAVANFKPRWMAVGVGGALQHWDPPGPGVHIENVGVEYLETPIAAYEDVGLSTTYWLKQILPNGLPEDDTEGVAYPDEYIIRLRCLYDVNDVSFVPSVDPSSNIYGTLVPISEVALFTSEADPTVKPDSSSGGVDGMIAYHVFATIPKTPGIILEVDWELRY